MTTPVLTFVPIGEQNNINLVVVMTAAPDKNKSAGMIRIGALLQRAAPQDDLAQGLMATPRATMHPIFQQARAALEDRPWHISPELVTRYAQFQPPHRRHMASTDYDALCCWVTACERALNTSPGQGRSRLRPA